MGRVRQGVALVSLGLLALACPAGALPADPEARFATCTGRLTALLEHQWLMQDPAAARTLVLRDAMADLLLAVADPGGSAAARALRTEAWAQEAALLARAAFGEGGTALRAGRAAAAQIGECEALLLIDLRA